MRRTGWLALVAVVTSACAPFHSSNEADPPRAAHASMVVAAVIDGDTLDVWVNESSRERVRLIGIDTPESVIPGVEPECFGPEAAERLKVLAPPGSPVRLERDVEARDPYGRLLAYAYVGDDMVNLVLAREGYAEVLSIPPNTAWVAEFRTAVAQAQRQRLGLWAACGR